MLLCTAPAKSLPLIVSLGHAMRPQLKFSSSCLLIKDNGFVYRHCCARRNDYDDLLYFRHWWVPSAHQTQLLSDYIVLHSFLRHVTAMVAYDGCGWLFENVRLNASVHCWPANDRCAIVTTIFACIQSLLVE